MMPLRPQCTIDLYRRYGTLLRNTRHDLNWNGWRGEVRPPVGSHPLPRISIPHLGFRYGYRSAGGSLKAGVRECAGGWSQARRAGRRGFATFAEPLRPGPIPESSIDSSATPAGADSFAKMEGESCLR